MRELAVTPLDMLSGDRLIYPDHSIELLALPRVGIADAYNFAVVVPAVTHHDHEGGDVMCGTFISFPDPTAVYFVLRPDRVVDPVQQAEYGR